MKKAIAFFAAVCLFAFPVGAAASSAADKPVKTLRVLVGNPEGGNDGRLNATYADGILLIDCDQALTGKAKLAFTFVTESGEPIPAKGNLAYLRDVDPDGLLDPSQTDLKLSGPQDLDILIDPAILALNIAIETEDAIYESPRISVLWRQVQAGPAMVAEIWPGTSLKLGVGQEISMDVRMPGPYTDKRVSLKPVGFDRFYAIEGMKVKGLSEGKQGLEVVNGIGVTIAQVEVTVQKDNAAIPTPPVPDALAYRVLVPSANVYAAPGDELRIGTLRQFQPVHVLKTEGDWSQLDTGVWLLSETIVPV